MLRIIAIAFLATISTNTAQAKTSAFNNHKADHKDNQVLVSLPNRYDASDIVKVEVDDYSYLNVIYRNKSTGGTNSVWCARYTDTGLEKTAAASKPVTKPLCDAGIAAFRKATQ